VAQQAPQADLSGVWGLLEAQQEQAARLLGDALPGMSALVEDRVGAGAGAGVLVCWCAGVLVCWCAGVGCGLGCTKHPPCLVVFHSLAAAPAGPLQVGGFLREHNLTHQVKDVEAVYFSLSTAGDCSEQLRQQLAAEVAAASLAAGEAADARSGLRAQLDKAEQKLGTVVTAWEVEWLAGIQAEMANGSRVAAALGRWGVGLGWAGLGWAGLVGVWMVNGDRALLRSAAGTGTRGTGPRGCCSPPSCPKDTCVPPLCSVLFCC
jgi:hypothetical protein